MKVPRTVLLLFLTIAIAAPTHAQEKSKNPPKSDH